MLKNQNYCLNPNCQKPNQENHARYCTSCGFDLLLNARYRALKPIGQGGFGKTYLAVDEYHSSQQHCVIKQFVPPNTSTATAAKLFQAEAIRLKQLGFHPQIPTFYDYIEQAGQRYIVQEWIDGQSLAEELQLIGAFSEVQVRSLLDSILPVLQFIHDNQVIHRDINPANIIRRANDGQLVLVDFGAAKYATATILGKTGTTIGSAVYVAPEQLFGKATFVSDLYSLGVTCIHLLTAIEPFDLYSTSEDNWVWSDYLIEPVSSELSQLLGRLLEKATSKRYQSAAAVLADKETVVKTQYLNLSTSLSLNGKSTGGDNKNCDFLPVHSVPLITSLKDHYFLQEDIKADKIAQPCPFEPIQQQDINYSRDSNIFGEKLLKLKLSVLDQLTIKFITVALAVRFIKIAPKRKVDKLPHETGNWGV